VRVQACLEYANAYSLRGSTNPTERFSGALSIYEFIPKHYPNPSDPLVWRAWGAMADCSFQLAVNDPTYYSQALAYYGKVTNAAAADMSARMQAIVGIGNVQREQARLATADARVLLDAASENYLSVLYRSYDSEPPDPYWLKEAALRAADVAASQEEWVQALNVYRRLLDMLPALRSNSILEAKILKVREKAALKRESQ
jgi:hypothetical protein